MESQRPLKNALLANAIFSTFSGLIFLMAASFVADLIGAGEPWLYQGLGAGLLGFAALVGWTATRPSIDTTLARMISFGDFGWVLGTIVVIAIFFTQLNGSGIVAMLVVAAIVLMFGLSQLRGIQVATA